MTKFRFKKLILSLSLLLNCGLAYSICCFSGQTFAESRRFEYENSDVIFLGVPVHFYENSNVARVKVGEVFKGTVDSIVYVVFEDVGFCFYDETHRSGIFRLWLIYGNECDYSDNDYYSVIRVDFCTNSRYMGRGFDIRFLPPHPDGISNHCLRSAIISASRHNHIDLLFFEEIEMLRTIRDVRNLGSVSNRLIQNCKTLCFNIFKLQIN